MNKFFNKAMDPLSSETHFIGACLSCFGLLMMIIEGVIKKTTLGMMVGTIVFGVSLIGLYSASTIYHFFTGSQKIKTILRKLDHSMIYVLIVGTYTPIVLYCMEAPHSYCFLAVLWLIAVLGIFMKILWINAPRVLTTLIYLILGWSLLFDFQSFQGIPFDCFILIAIGGVAYSIGAMIYMIKKPNISQCFGFHELFHVFVMLGSFFHYLAIYMFLL